MAENINFSTNGWYGIIDVDLTNKSVARAAQAFADYLIAQNKGKDKLKIAVGFDGRNHSKPWALLFARVLSGNNINVYLSDRTCPTSIIHFYVKKNKLTAGVMITGGSLSSEYNGVEFITSHGVPFSINQLIEIEDLLGKELVQADDENIYQTDLSSLYYAHLEEQFDFEAIKKSGLNILIDSMAGAGQQALETLFMRYEIRSKTIFKIAEKNFTGRKPYPSEINLQPLKDELLKDSYSFGIALSGDAGTVGIVMGTGEYLGTQELNILIADYLVNKKNIPGDLIQTASVTNKFRPLFENEKRKVHEVAPGFLNVSEKMSAVKALFGCDASGGYSFHSHLLHQDGIYSALIITEMLANSGLQKLSDFVNKKRQVLGRVYYVCVDIKSDDGARSLTSLYNTPPETIGRFKVVSLKEFYGWKQDISGVKFSFEGNNRWLLFRVNDLKSVIRISAEAESDETINDLIEAGKHLLTKLKD